MVENKFSSMSDKELHQVLRDFEVYLNDGTLPKDSVLVDIRDYYCDQSDIRGVRLMEQDMLIECSHRLCAIFDEMENKKGRKAFNWKSNRPADSR